MLQKLSQGILLRESICLLYILTCLIMPMVGYVYYSINNPLSRIWVGYMQVPENVYYSYSLPAISLFCLALTFPLANDRDTGERLRHSIALIKNKLKTDHSYSIVILSVGFVASIITPFLPAGLQFFSNLFYFSSFAGLLYIFFSRNFKYKRIIFILFGISLFAGALSLGMFTVVAYMGITIFSFFFLGRTTSFFKKLLVFATTIAFFIVLQNVKGGYRKAVWKSNYSGNTALLFVNLFVENLQKGDALIEPEAFFPLYVRTNQGYNVSKVMKRIPAIKPYDEGSRLATVLASAFVPRFLWPDKPEAGGKFNMEYYAGWRITGWSTNVGPLGEAYGSFGVTGGIIYMFLMGLFIRWAYLLVFKAAENTPLLLCWLPVFFFQITSSAETDSLQIFNSLIKASFFVWLLYKILPVWFGQAKQLYSNTKKRLPVAESA